MSAAIALANQPASCDAAFIARCAVDALRLELDTYPKPGLVSLVDSGSHDDMDAASFTASAAALEPFFQKLAESGSLDTSMDGLRRIGIEAEAAMRRATSGVNTHRGAIFGLGLLASAAGALGAGIIPIHPGALGAHVAERHAQMILNGPVLLHAPGARVRREHSVGGAPAEAAAGFPTVYRIGLPALRRGGALQPDDPKAARVEACFALIATTEDTNLLHRGGPDGLAFAQQSAADFLAQGGVAQPDWRQAADQVHREFVARRLSPGGTADLLAMTLFIAGLEDGETQAATDAGSRG